MASRRDEEFNEEEMWSYYEEEKEQDSGPTTPPWDSSSSSSSTSSSAWRLSTASRMVPRVSNTTSLSAKLETDKIGQQQSSAPVNIPDWSKIYGNMDDSCTRVENGDDDGTVLPPHEWLARKLERSQISSFSVCEGIGRKLKGRDLSKVRHAVLTKTGFIE